MVAANRRGLDEKIASFFWKSSFATEAFETTMHGMDPTCRKQCTRLRHQIRSKKNFNPKSNKHIVSNCQRKYIEFQVSLEIEKAMVVTLNLQGHGLDVFRFKVGVWETKRGYVPAHLPCWRYLFFPWIIELIWFRRATSTSLSIAR